MLFYPSKNNNRLNGARFDPDLVTGRAMVNPHYRVLVAPGTRYLIDSGAFQERDMHARLQPWAALDRQLRLEAQIELSGGPEHAEAIVTYDMIDGVDEALQDGQRVKRRGDEQTATLAVRETIRSARYYKSQEHRVRGGIAYACQGVTPRQYVACAEQIIPLIRPGRDMFAFGGFCIIGMQPRLKAVFYETLAATLPLLRAAGVARAHLLGVTVTDAITHAADAARAYGITLSTDSSGPERNAAAYGRGFSAHPCPGFRQVYQPAQKFIDYHPCTFALESIGSYDRWASTL